MKGEKDVRRYRLTRIVIEVSERSKIDASTPVSEIGPLTLWAAQRQAWYSSP